MGAVVEISTMRTFEAAHHLPRLPIEHKCNRVHGHNYKIEVAIRAEIDEHLGMAFDYTGLRRGDVLRLPWSAYDGARIVVVTSKRGVLIDVPAHRDLRQLLDAAERRSPTIVTDARGRPFREDTFSHRFAAEVASLEVGVGCTFHGLRATAGRLLAEAGASAHEIMAILGCSIKTADHYCRNARRALMADAAIMKLERGGNQE